VDNTRRGKQLVIVDVVAHQILSLPNTSHDTLHRVITWVDNTGWCEQPVIADIVAHQIMSEFEASHFTGKLALDG
jgi:hypothetical protein